MSAVLRALTMLATARASPTARAKSVSEAFQACAKSPKKVISALKRAEPMPLMRLNATQ